MVEVHSNSLEGRRVLLVEDDYLTAADWARALEGCGAHVIGPARSVGDAMALLATESVIEAAILDVHLGSEKIFPVARALFERSVPFVFVSGYRISDLPHEFEDAPIYGKPVDVAWLAGVLAKRLH